MITASFMKELTIVAKVSVLDVCRGPGYASGTSNYKPAPHTETSQLICMIDQLTCLYMIAKLSCNVITWHLPVVV